MLGPVLADALQLQRRAPRPWSRRERKALSFIKTLALGMGLGAFLAWLCF